LQRPNLYRIDWTQTGGLYVGKGVVWSDGNGDYLETDSADKITNAQAQRMHNMQFALGGAGGASSSAASMIPGIFFSKMAEVMLCSLQRRAEPNSQSWPMKKLVVLTA
jgi:hypothetical protein